MGLSVLLVFFFLTFNYPNRFAVAVWFLNSLPVSIVGHVKVFVGVLDSSFSISE